MQEEQLQYDSKTVIHRDTGIPFRKIRHNWKKPFSQPYEKERLPLNPWFCPKTDEVTGKKCGKLMDIWDSLIYNTFGMCNDCVKKYNLQLQEEQEEKEV